MIYEEKDIDTQVIEIAIQEMENKCNSTKEKVIYLRNLIEYLNTKIKAYKEFGVNSGVGMFLIGTGLGIEINSEHNIYILITLCTLGVTVMLVPAIKRKQKNNNDQIKEFEEIENKILKKK